MTDDGADLPLFVAAFLLAAVVILFFFCKPLIHPPKRNRHV